jgi:phosphate transport system substrate-binding protein
MFVVATVLLATVVVPAKPAAAADQIKGSGSTWSYIAVNAWIADVAAQGLSVIFNPNGSSAGRNFYISDPDYDFAVSEIPFQPASRDRDGNVLYDEIARASARPYAYLPIVAGGTSLMYHLDVNGQRVTDLRLTGATIAKIFTGQITNWNDPAIAADDGRTFPSLPITPVIRSDGSGTSAQFTAYMANMFPEIWNPFCTAKTNLPAPCPPTSYYPLGDNRIAQAQSIGVAEFVKANHNNGSITYVEYGYAKERGFPVAEVLNAAGYYSKPTAVSVAIALTKARLNPDRTQILDDVYRNPDPRAYPISSYSYMIVPTAISGNFTEGKGQTLGRFILYFLCTGQQKADRLGYSPLPPNLVEFGFEAVTKIPGAPSPPPLNQCANPTITGLFSTANAPLPDASQRKGAPRRAAANNNSRGQNGAVTQSDAGTTDTTIAEGTTDDTLSGESIDSDLAAARREAPPTSVSREQDDVPIGIYVAIIVMVLLVVFIPPALHTFLKRKR